MQWAVQLAAHVGWFADYQEAALVESAMQVEDSESHCAADGAKKTPLVSMLTVKAAAPFGQEG